MVAIMNRSFMMHVPKSTTARMRMMGLRFMLNVLLLQLSLFHSILRFSRTGRTNVPSSSTTCMYRLQPMRFGVSFRSYFLCTGTLVHSGFGVDLRGNVG